MRTTVETFQDLAATLDYPAPDTAARARRAARALAAGSPSASKMARALEELAVWLANQEHGAPEERYTQLFDLNPVCTLNVGFHLLGDSYPRGALLASLAGELNRAGIAHDHDLPDHLPTMLRLLGHLKGAEERSLLVHAVLVPALGKMAAALEKSPDAWPELLRSLPAWLDDEVPRGAEEIPILRRPLEVVPCSM